MKEDCRSCVHGDITQRRNRLSVTKVSIGEHNHPIEKLKEEEKERDVKQRNREEMRNTGEESKRRRRLIHGEFPAELSDGV